MGHQASMICAHEDFRARNVRANILLGARKNRARKILYENIVPPRNNCEHEYLILKNVINTVKYIGELL